MSDIKNTLSSPQRRECKELMDEYHNIIDYPACDSNELKNAFDKFRQGIVSMENVDQVIADFRQIIYKNEALVRYCDDDNGPLLDEDGFPIDNDDVSDHDGYDMPYKKQPW
jgi:hypothetical protein